MEFIITRTNIERVEFSWTIIKKYLIETGLDKEKIEQIDEKKDVDLVYDALLDSCNNDHNILYDILIEKLDAEQDYKFISSSVEIDIPED